MSFCCSRFLLFSVFIVFNASYFFFLLFLLREFVFFISSDSYKRIICANLVYPRKSKAYGKRSGRLERVCNNMLPFLATLGGLVTIHVLRLLGFTLGILSFWRFSHRDFRLMPSFSASSVSVIWSWLSTTNRWK